VIADVLSNFSPTSLLTLNKAAKPTNTPRAILEVELGIYD
jgi:hypothetical protein